ncbi:hypothetical protein HOF56_00780 [Candidatus Peribacteria bacterium]|jgi:hypothetical protein|nr:hypothetical protein [Candidatus Peribacteria bacterium]MBT4021353.1 hypothetical protein [Candidatus Peribacteria bacterium]MBT4241257.1 hypothetical protein [Candidatus Peribacteria bacterium]MBT4474282.1 hypothetical protein [Candidatus Peribacteria bacterium]
MNKHTHKHWQDLELPYKEARFAYVEPAPGSAPDAGSADEPEAKNGDADIKNDPMKDIISNLKKTEGKGRQAEMLRGIMIDFLKNEEAKKDNSINGIILGIENVAGIDFPEELKTEQAIQKIAFESGFISFEDLKEILKASEEKKEAPKAPKASERIPTSLPALAEAITKYPDLVAECRQALRFLARAERQTKNRYRAMKLAPSEQNFVRNLHSKITQIPEAQKMDKAMLRAMQPNDLRGSLDFIRTINKFALNAEDDRYLNQYKESSDTMLINALEELQERKRHLAKGTLKKSANKQVGAYMNNGELVYTDGIKEYRDLARKYTTLNKEFKSRNKEGKSYASFKLEYDDAYKEGYARYMGELKAIGTHMDLEHEAQARISGENARIMASYNKNRGAYNLNSERRANRMGVLGREYAGSRPSGNDADLAAHLESRGGWVYRNGTYVIPMQGNIYRTNPITGLEEDVTDQRNAVASGFGLPKNIKGPKNEKWRSGNWAKDFVFDRPESNEQREMRNKSTNRMVEDFEKMYEKFQELGERFKDDPQFGHKYREWERKLLEEPVDLHAFLTDFKHQIEAFGKAEQVHDMMDRNREKIAKDAKGLSLSKMLGVEYLYNIADYKVTKIRISRSDGNTSTSANYYLGTVDRLEDNQFDAYDSMGIVIEHKYGGLKGYRWGEEGKGTLKDTGIFFSKPGTYKFAYSTEQSGSGHVIKTSTVEVDDKLNATVKRNGQEIADVEFVPNEEKSNDDGEIVV